MAGETTRAAVAIQASYRGFQARKQAKKMKAEETEAARRIQSIYRGFQVMIIY